MADDFITKFGIKDRRYSATTPMGCASGGCLYSMRIGHDPGGNQLAGAAVGWPHRIPVPDLRPVPFTLLRAAPSSPLSIDLNNDFTNASLLQPFAVAFLVGYGVEVFCALPGSLLPAYKARTRLEAGAAPVHQTA
nr:hypothetical protein [uncultured Rhodopila sp.]